MNHSHESVGFVPNAPWYHSHGSIWSSTENTRCHHGHSPNLQVLSRPSSALLGHGGKCSQAASSGLVSIEMVFGISWSKNPPDWNRTNRKVLIPSRVAPVVTLKRFSSCHESSVSTSHTVQLPWYHCSELTQHSANHNHRKIENCNLWRQMHSSMESALSFIYVFNQREVKEDTEHQADFRYCTTMYHPNHLKCSSGWNAHDLPVLAIGFIGFLVCAWSKGSVHAFATGRIGTDHEWFYGTHIEVALQAFSSAIKC